MSEISLSPNNFEACLDESEILGVSYAAPELWVSPSDTLRLEDMYHTLLRAQVPSFGELTEVGYGAISEFGERNSESAQAIAVLIIAGIETSTRGAVTSLLELLKETQRFSEKDFLALRTIINDIHLLLHELDNFEMILPEDAKQAVVEYIEMVTEGFYSAHSDSELKEMPVFRGIMAYAAGATLHTPSLSQTFFSHLY